MKIYIFSFTRAGNALSLKLKELLKNTQPEGEGFCSCLVPYRFRADYECSDFEFCEDIRAAVKKVFLKENCLIFIGACGIAVRYIAPFIKSKETDPCVLCMDEKGKNVISLLSGHLGGGNEFTKKISRLIGANPVITTASDVNEIIAVDVFAKNNDLAISDMKLAKEAQASILENGNAKIEIDIKNGEGLRLIPKELILGVGCKRGIEPEALLDFVRENLENNALSEKAVSAVATIDIKRDEPAVLELAKELGAKALFFSAKELSEVKGEFQESDFVKNVTGVSNVCERAAVLGGAKNLLIKKTAKNGMTLALGAVKRAHRILIFAGTNEGRELAEYFSGNDDVSLTFCTATEYGASLLPECENIKVYSGRMDEKQMSALMSVGCFELCIDATHPYAAVVTENIKNAAKKTETEYIRLLRPSNDSHNYDGVVYVKNVQQAAELLSKNSGNILSTIGSKELDKLLTIPDYENRLFARILPTPQMVSRACDLGIKGKNLICMQGPFNTEINCALINNFNIKYLITKDTGAEGGFLEKIEAAEKCGITTVVIERPDAGTEGFLLNEVTAKIELLIKEYV